MHIIEGNLIDLTKEGFFDVIVHGCNCFNVMGKGIARNIAYNFPMALDADTRTLKGDPFKLGRYTKALYRSESGKLVTIVNGYTQYRPGKNLDLKALESVFGLVALHFKEAKIGFPLIGCGLAGGDWNRDVHRIINRMLIHIDRNVVVLPDSTPILTSLQDLGDFIEESNA